MNPMLEAATMRGPVKRYHCEDHWESENGTFYHESDYEARVREREEAERKLADALQSVQSWQMEVLGRDSDIEQLLALLDEAPHSPACRKMDVQLKGAYSLACNCWKSRIPRAGG